MKKRKRGRPPGPTAQGLRTRETLYETAIRAFGEHGYEATTMRRVAMEAGVSPGLLYRYFPSKSAVVGELYDRLSASFATFAPPPGTMADRFDATLQASLATLQPHHDVLRALLGVLLRDPAVGLLAPATVASRQRVRGRFEAAMAGATDAPEASFAVVLGRLAYWAQMATILWWLLDRSPHRRATDELRGWWTRALRLLSATRWVPGLRTTLGQLDELVSAALLAGGE